MWARFVVTLIIVLFAGASVTEAQVPRRFYDWSSTLDVQTQNVLGEATESAQTKNTQPESYKQFSGYVFGGDFTPASPFYFFKRFQETVQLATTFDQKQKEALRIAIAGERLDEIKQLSDTTNSGAIRQASAGYEQMMKDIVDNLERQEHNKQTDEKFIKLFEEETAKHSIVLEQSYTKLPDELKSVIKTARESSWESMDRTADLSEKPALPSDVVDRIQALKAQGLMSEEETNKLIGIKTRVEAREELQKYANEGILPEADFIRMNENVKTYFPEEFYKMHEVKRFYELRKLESQKPDDATLTRIQEFARTYQQGDVVPSDIRRYWVPVIRLEEIQNTLRPDLIDSELFKKHEADYKKFTEIVERFKPRPEDYARVADYVRQNPNAQLPPEYERMYELGNRYGAQCGSGQRWVNRGLGAYITGFCVSNEVSDEQLPNIQPVGQSCSGSPTSAKGPGNVCSVFPSDCVPSGWTRTTTCVETPQPTSSPQNPRTVSCPSNAHFVAIPYAPEGGYCVPNYSPASPGNDPNTQQTPCTAGYHRNYPGGTCLPDYNPNTQNPFVPYTPNPGDYPSPIYPRVDSCGSGYHWVPEPINPRGGYCASDNYQQTQSCPEGQYRGPGGYCITGGGSNCTPPSSGCGAGFYWDSGRCSCQSTSNPQPTGNSGYSPSREQQESACRAGGGTCVSWVNNACGCVRPNEYPNYPQPTSSPPSGYGSCGSGLYWNGSACVSSGSSEYSPSREQQESACRAGGGTCVSWNNDACGCERTGSQSNTPQTTSAPQPTATPNPNDPAEMCRRANGSWNGSSCIMPTMSPEQGCGSAGGKWENNSCIMPTRTPEQACQSGGGSWNGSSCTMPPVAPTNP